MPWFIVFGSWTVAVAVVIARLVAVRRSRFKPRLPTEVGVTLSVLPSRTAVVMLDLGADASSAAVAPLVEQAVSEALAFKSVDVVEVRARDGQLLDRRCRDDVITA